MKIFKNFTAVILFILLIMILLIGIGLVDNANKIALNNPFLNGFGIDIDNYILWFRYLGLNFKINCNPSEISTYIIPPFKMIYLSILVIFSKVRILLESLV